MNILLLYIKFIRISVMVGDPADLKIRKIKINDFEKKMARAINYLFKEVKL